ncbi:MAG: hypothetical protein JST40_12550 [Armatimonadetes bacterium]|nr:hypothetical protein [Armatimonadota bacterium]
MNRLPLHRARKTLQGQTLIIAILILGVLFVLGVTFAVVVSRNLRQTALFRERTLSSDLAEAGIRNMHYQLVNSSLGADWRPESSGLAIDIATGLSKDPDALYLRGGSNRLLPGGLPDKGGPDGLGPYSRQAYNRGRALVRVRYAPADFTAFAAGSSQLRQLGKARSYLVLESVGRSGAVNPNDPSTLLSSGVKVSGFTSDQDLLASLNKLKSIDSTSAETRKLVAVASLGSIEQARFITNKFRVTDTAEVGALGNSGAGVKEEGTLAATFEGSPVTIPTQLGWINSDTTVGSPQVGSGSLYSNADIKIFGPVTANLNPSLGDMWAVAGNLSAANANSGLTLASPAGVLGTLSGPNLNSRSANYTTFGGLLRDGIQDADSDGYSRSIPRKEPPSILTVDPTTKLNRYLVLTRESGRLVNGRNSGRFGHGSGVYVSGSSADVSDATDEEQRIRLGASRSLPQQWLNPNNQTFGRTGSWQGPYFVPQASYLKLIPDGFEITKESRTNADGRRTDSTWYREDGSSAATSWARFLIREVNDGSAVRPYIINSVKTPAVGNASASIPDQTFLSEGRPFNGVVYFEGDVRTRGVIPTDQQLTVVSMGTIYIEGSITKGIELDGTIKGTPSKSMLALMAKDYICVNTTMFFGPVPGETWNVKDTSGNVTAPNPVEIDLSSGALTLQTDLLLNPEGDNAVASDPKVPTSWRPYATTYREAGSNSQLNSQILIQHSADNGGPSEFAMSIAAAGSGVNSFLFPSYVDQAGEFNGTLNQGWADLIGVATKSYGQAYMLHETGRNIYPQFETLSLPLAVNGGASNSQFIDDGNVSRPYRLRLQQTTEFTLGLSGFGSGPNKNYLLGKVAVSPADVRIEAALFAEEGSFFVIPGPVFNSNSTDTRDNFNTDVAANGLANAQENRFRNFGSMPETPFYGEPQNVRIVISGSLAENMPAPISQQAEWQKLWGWMPRWIGGSGKLLPAQHVPAGYDVTGNSPANRYVPNLIIGYDPSLAFGTSLYSPTDPIRTTADGRWILPPLPRLPVSPTLLYFGEVNP